MMLAVSDVDLSSLDKDYYLLSFSDDELFDILCKPDEWNEFDYQVARKLLMSRGKDVGDQVVSLLRQQRIKQLAQPEDRHTNWLYAGYVFAVFGGIFGIFIGWHLSSAKKTLPDGQHIYSYSDNDRAHGRRIVIIGLCMFAFTLIMNLMPNYRY